MAMESTTTVTRPRAAVAPPPPITVRGTRSEEPNPPPSDVSALEARQAERNNAADQRETARQNERVSAERTAVREGNVGSLINLLV